MDVFHVIKLYKWHQISQRIIKSCFNVSEKFHISKKNSLNKLLFLASGRTHV